MRSLLAKLAALRPPAWLAAAFPAVLAAAFCLSDRAGMSAFGELLYSTGGYLLAGLPNPRVTWQLPFFHTAVSFLLNAGFPGPLLFCLLQLAAYAMVFATGALLAGYRGGLLALAVSGLAGRGGPVDHGEQLLYSFFLLLLASLLALYRREGGSRLLACCGLAAGFTLSVRTPLLLFPLLAPLLVPAALRARPRAAAGTLVFFAAAYALLAPWLWLNYKVTGALELPESRRGELNLISTALGSVRTVSGDARAAAGLRERESALAFFAAKAAADPAGYALATLRRLREVFAFQPLAAGFFLLALAFGRKRGFAAAAALPAYFVLIHSLFSLEERYLAPLRYLLPAAAAGLLLPDPPEEPGRAWRLARGFVLASFWVSLAAVLAGFDALALAYPARSAAAAATPGMYGRAARDYPRDRNFRELACREKWRDGDYPGFRACLADYARDFPAPVPRYFLDLTSAAAPAAAPFPEKGAEHFLTELHLLRALRELQLGNSAGARTSLERSLGSYSAMNGLVGGSSPYAADRRLDELLKSDLGLFYKVYVARQSLFWPPGEAAALLRGLSRLAGPRPELAELERELASASGAGGEAARARLSASVFGLEPAGAPAAGR